MARKRLSELMIGRIAPPKTGRLELADAVLPGLSLRVTPDGTRSFALRYRIDGKQQRLTLGRYDPERFNLAAARAKARTALDQRDAGKDPAKAKSDLPARGTVREVAEDYVERHVRKNVKRVHDVEMMLKRDIVAHWGDRPVADISRRDVLDLVDGVVDRGSPVAANRVLSLVKALLGFAVDRGAVEANVAAGIKPPAKEKPRDRTLTEAELRAVWGAFDRVGYPFGAMGKLLVLTAQRRGEVASMRWSQVDLDAATWRLESTDTKAGRRHVVPLSPQVIDILRALPRFAGDDRVFPAARAGSANAMSGFSKALHRIDAEVARANAERRLGRPLVKGEKPGAGDALKPWHFHDLRRTATTGMARLSIPPHICEKVLNHSAGRTLSQVARVYNVHSYGDEVRRALEAWALEVECIVTGQPAKVVAARAAAA